MLKEPGFVGAYFKIIFNEEKSKEDVNNFVKELMEMIFDISSKEEKLIGHLKLYSKSNNGSKIRANLTGLKKNLTIFFDNWKEDKIFEFWLNLISFFKEGKELEKSLKDILRDLVKRYNGTIKEYNASLEAKHQH
ncbi:hypothetical protein HRbin06_00930 [archaeon HR06]|nr:hypothetical protein HRbin06_00930 [archaeon HR06]